MTPQPIQPPDDTRAVLADADFSDAFALIVDEPALTARAAAEAVFEHVPGWIARLLALRDAMVKPLGLKATNEVAGGEKGRVGFFPVLAETEQRLVLGLDDAHLDFRIVVDVAPAGPDRQQVIATTLVRRHNLFGRAYLAAVMPFHKVIVPTMLKRIARAA